MSPSRTKRQLPQQKQQLQSKYDIGDGESLEADGLGICRMDSRGSACRKNRPRPPNERTGTMANGTRRQLLRTESVHETRERVSCGQVGSRPVSDVCDFGKQVPSRLYEKVHPTRCRSSSYDMGGGNAYSNRPIINVSSVNVNVISPASRDLCPTELDHHDVPPAAVSASNGVGPAMGTAVGQFVGLAVGTRGAMERSLRSPRFVARLEPQPEEASSVFNSDAQQTTPKDTHASPPIVEHFQRANQN